MSDDSPLRIGTRASKLARWQSDWTASRLRETGVAVEIVEIVTIGDVQQTGPVASMSQQGVFTKEIQRALLDGEVDLAVHSLKDLPTETVAGLHLAATPPRENPADALVSAKYDGLEALPLGAVVGTGSLRRRAQLKAVRPDLEVAGIRGNVDTRLRKLDEGQYDAIVLAAAGLTRLGWEERITQRLQPPLMLPAPGQGALGIECREDDERVRTVLNALDHPATRQATTAERAMLAALHGGCSAPIAAWGRVEGDRLLLDGLVADLEGATALRAHGAGPVADAMAIASQVAGDLREQGADAIIRAARGE